MKKFLFVLAVVALVAGCGSGGGGSSSSGLSASASGLSDGITSGDSETGDGEVGAIKVHNPEPATLVLFGIGAAGIASKVLKKRKK